jgi:hypothetical protein
MSACAIVSSIDDFKVEKWLAGRSGKMGGRVRLGDSISASGGASAAAREMGRGW